LYGAIPPPYVVQSSGAGVLNRFVMDPCRLNCFVEHDHHP
jgi:hypothetical protein